MHFLQTPGRCAISLFTISPSTWNEAWPHCYGLHALLFTNNRLRVFVFIPNHSFWAVPLVIELNDETRIQSILKNTVFAYECTCEEIWCVSLSTRGRGFITWLVPFSVAEKVVRVWVSAVKVNVMEQTNKEQPQLSFSFEDDLAVLQTRESNKLRCENFAVNLWTHSTKFLKLCRRLQIMHITIW